MLDDLVMNETTFDGVEFTLVEGFSRRKCIVLRQALYMLSEDADPQDLTAIYRRNEHRIHQVARRLISSGFSDTPVIIGPWSFRTAAA
jgi:hypothetical protein